MLKPKKMTDFSKVIRHYTEFPSLLMLFLSYLIAFFFTPNDVQQGIYAKILFVHVPASWGALSVYTAMALFSSIGLVIRVPQMFLLAKALAPIGFIYCIISLVTGSLWGKPTWGAFWVWDARLTSMFILLLLYVSYLHLSDTYSPKKLVPASFIVVLGFVNIPIIKGSVEWWYTLHQPASIRVFERTSTMDWQMAWPLYAVTFSLVAFTICLCAMRLIYLIQKSSQENQYQENQ
jgi:heme exporter protein C